MHDVSFRAFTKKYLFWDDQREGEKKRDWVNNQAYRLSHIIHDIAPSFITLDDFLADQEKNANQ